MFNQYPYLNINDLNLDYLLKAIKEMRYEVTNFVSLNAIKYADPIQWDITRQYEKNTIVIDPLTGVAYISVQPVPRGVALTREEYWTVVFDLGRFVARAAQNFTEHYEPETTLISSYTLEIGDWVVWGDVLYKVIEHISLGEYYVVGTNIEHFTMKDLYDAYLVTIADIYDKMGDINDLETVDKSNIVNAINEVHSDLETETTEREDADNDILEKLANLGQYSVKDYGAVGDGQTDDTAAIQATIDAAMENGGGRVVLPTGNYLITSTLIIRPYTASAHPVDPADIHFEYMDLIQFIGVGNVTITAGAAMQYMLRSDDFTIGGVGSFSNFYTEISNIKFIGANLAECGVYIYEMLHGRIYNLRIDGVQDGILVSGYGQLDVRNCIIRATNRCYMSTGGGDSLIENNDLYCHSETAKGFVLTQWAGSTVINKNNIVIELAAGETNNTIGIQVYNGNDRITSPLYITHNILDGVHRGINLYSSVLGEVGGIVIDGNKFVSFTEGDGDFVVMQNIFDSMVVNNIVPTPTNNGMKPRIFAELTGCQKITINNNIIDGAIDCAMKLFSCIGCIVSNNHIWDASQTNDDGYIMIYGSSYRNNIYDNVLRAVSITSTKGIVEYGSSDYNMAYNNDFQNITTPYIKTGTSTRFNKTIRNYNMPTDAGLAGDVAVNLTNNAYDALWVYNNNAWRAVRFYEHTGAVRFTNNNYEFFDGTNWIIKTGDVRYTAGNYEYYDGTNWKIKTGEVRYNTATSTLQYYDGTTWQDITI